MELNLQVNDDVARKLRGLCVLTGKTPDEINNLIANEVDGMLTEAIVASVGGRGKFTEPAVDRGATVTPTDADVEEAKYLAEKEMVADFEYVEPMEPINTNVFDEDEVESAAEGLSELTEEELDQELPTEFVEDMKEIEEEPEEEEVPVMDKDGEETTYDDELMADLQAMAEGDEFEESGESSGDDIIAAAAASIKGESGGTASEATENSVMNDDSLVTGPDVLPVDLGIDDVSFEKNKKGAMNFFEAAFAPEDHAEVIDKSRRAPKVRRKPVGRH